MADALSQQITRILGADDWVILHGGHTLVSDEDLDALELADDVRTSEAGDTEWDRLAQARQVWKVIRGAQADMLNGRPDMDAMEEIALSSAQMDQILDPEPSDPEPSDIEHDLLALAQLIADAYYEMQAGQPPMPGREPAPNESDMQLAYTLTQHGYRRTT